MSAPRPVLDEAIRAALGEIDHPLFRRPGYGFMSVWQGHRRRVGDLPAVLRDVR